MQSISWTGLLRRIPDRSERALTSKRHVPMYRLAQLFKGAPFK